MRDMFTVAVIILAAVYVVSFIIVVCQFGKKPPTNDSVEPVPYSKKIHEAYEGAEHDPPEVRRQVSEFYKNSVEFAAAWADLKAVLAQDLRRDYYRFIRLLQNIKGYFSRFLGSKW